MRMRYVFIVRERLVEDLERTKVRFEYCSEVKKAFFSNLHSLGGSVYQHRPCFCLVGV